MHFKDFSLGKLTIATQKYKKTKSVLLKLDCASDLSSLWKTLLLWDRGGFE